MGLPRTILTEYEYLEFERASPERHQCVDGEVFAMAGESLAHGDISVNIVGSLTNQLLDSPCRVRIANSRVRSGPLPKSRKHPSGLYSYPDVFVVCDEPEFLDEHRDVIINPTVIFEVLSKSTESFDRGTKFLRYQRHNPTLTDYVLVSRDQHLIEHYRREADGSWKYQRHDGLKTTIKLPSIGCRLKAADVYRRVEFKELDDD